MEEFLAWYQSHFIEGTFIKLTLSKPANKSSSLRNIYLRKVLIKGIEKIQFTFRYQDKDVVKNCSLQESCEQLATLSGKDFLTLNLLTSTEDVRLFFNKKRKIRIQKSAPSMSSAPALEHNKSKNYIIDENARFLEQLGVASNGRVLKAYQDKYRQINKYVEIMAGLLSQITTNNTLNVVDMGCGKGYLTFALYAYMQQHLPKAPLVTGIELREHLTAFCNEKAAVLGWSNLSFIAQDIMTYDNHKIDVLIALHACDIATDIAIAKGIQAEAQLIVCAPCCHKQIRKAIQKGHNMQALLKHGILEERQAEIITDGIRALCLEAYGYETKVFEFVSLEHTAKNIMITAVKKRDNRVPDSDIIQQINQIKKSYGINQHYLEKLLT